jgi:Coenzyme PQQ synthesis protein D (PqqD)
MLNGGGVAVISEWDERASGFEAHRLLRNPKIGEYILANMLRQGTFIRSQAVVARVVAGETLLVPVRARVGDLASIYSFNGTGTLIWKLLESPRTVAELATAVAEQYEVDPAQAEHDVTEFVGEMKSVGLVEVPAAMLMAGD